MLRVIIWTKKPLRILLYMENEFHNVLYLDFQELPDTVLPACKVNFCKHGMDTCITVLIGYYDYLGTRPKKSQVDNCHRAIILE